jgi:adenylate cyclase
MIDARATDSSCQDASAGFYWPIMRNDGHVAILFADIAGSTRIYESLGDDVAHRIVREMLRRAGLAVEAKDGTVVKTIGDELMAAFASADDAVAAAIDVQRGIDDAPPITTKAGPMRLSFRIGMHVGPAVQENGDYFGDTVNVAARMVGLAKAGQILTTGEALALLPAAERGKAATIGEVEVKGRAEAVSVAQVEWRAQPQTTTVLRFAERAEPNREPELRLVFEGRSWRVPPDRKALSCGRDAGSDIVLKGSQASRSHATIERRRGKVFLIDHSTNGTHLILDEQRSAIRLHREEFGLVRQGCIIFGSLDREEADTVWFFFA